MLPILETLQTSWEQMLADPQFAPVHAGLEHGLANLRKWYKKTDETDIYFVCMRTSSRWLMPHASASDLSPVLDPTVKLEYFKEEWDESWINMHLDRFKKKVCCDAR